MVKSPHGICDVLSLCSHSLSLSESHTTNQAEKFVSAGVLQYALDANEFNW